MEIDIDEPTRPQLAAVFGVSSRWIGELRAQGDLPKDGASLLENIEAWAQAKYGVEGAQGDIDFDTERARLTKEQADSKAMDNAERRKELASLPDMSGAVISVIALTVTRLQQVGLEVANGDHKLRARIDRAIADALDEMSVAKVEEARGGGLHEEDGPDDES
ncbi:terminase [Sphingomonas sp. MG17]|uniref:Terminase n=1 Tax=Sphingomonas tagetis TaxID=2949092 RepID=A0A9X2HSX1_9SPHN|nr:terminase [Sphingomonas tagetis]MCP3732035.1 terminase [Sphingomonas tagetis]